MKNETELYEKWLLENYSDEIHNKDNLMEMVRIGYGYDEFIDEVMG